MGKMIITRKKLLVVAGSSLLALTACGGGGGKETGDAAGTGGDNKPAVKAEPVTIVLSRTPNYKMDPIENAINTTLAKKYPHITLEWRTEEGGNNMEGQVTAGQPPDVTLGASSSVNTLKQLGLAFDLTPLITKHKFDLSQYESRMLEMMRLKAEDGKMLYALPYANGFNLMYYNKDIFDKLGVTYPTDGMTWEQVGELAKKVTRVDSGVQYYGIGFAGNKYTPFRFQYGLALVDKNGKAAVNTDGWKKAFELGKYFYDTAGVKSPKLLSSPKDMFTKEKTVGMFVANNEIRNMLDVNWDMVSMPSPAEIPGIGGNSPYNIISVTSASTHKDEAFQVLMTIMSDEVQTAVAGFGMPSPLKAEKYKQVYAKDIPEAKGKNLGAVFKNKPAPLVDDTELDAFVNKELNTSMMNVLEGKKDVNTALREAEEKGNMAISAQKIK